MKKLKKVWQENSVLFVLLFILIACLIAISVVVVTYFVGDSSSKYGDRLEGIEDYPFDTDMQNEIIALASLDYFSEETLSFYDLEYMIEAEATEETEGFKIIGAKNVTGTGGIVWNNNTEFEDEEEVTEE